MVSQNLSSVGSSSDVLGIKLIHALSGVFAIFLCFQTIYW